MIITVLKATKQGNDGKVKLRLSNLQSHLKGKKCAPSLYNILHGTGQVEVDGEMKNREGKQTPNDVNLTWAHTQRKRHWDGVLEKLRGNGKQSNLLDGVNKMAKKARSADAKRFIPALHQVAAFIDIGAAFSSTESVLLQKWLGSLGVDINLYSRPHLYNTVQ